MVRSLHRRQGNRLSAFDLHHDGNSFFFVIAHTFETDEQFRGCCKIHFTSLYRLTIQNDSNKPALPSVKLQILERDLYIRVLEYTKGSTLFT